VRRSHVLGVIPWQQLIDVGLFVPACDGCQDVRQIPAVTSPAMRLRRNWSSGAQCYINWVEAFGARMARSEKPPRHHVRRPLPNGVRKRVRHKIRHSLTLTGLRLGTNKPTSKTCCPGTTQKPC